ncbi:MAG: PQQ-binding-like beta-propeller repeat protein [Candidatus Aenigmarchaeota archaeon]|nr:PQQ-binding-like beta-propeller repeat protein [Candidatus Aenigmarchaeota archaeon]
MTVSENRGLDVSKVSECGISWATPAVQKGRIYFGTLDTYFYCLDLDTGQKLWETKLDGMVASSAVIENGVIYFGCFDSNLYALDQNNGAILWKHKTDGIIVSSPAIHNKIIYFGSCDQNLYALSLETREVLWKFRTGDEIVGGILIHKGRIYFGSMDNYFYCLSFKGNLLWRFRTGGSIITGRPDADEERVYFASCDQNIYAFTLEGDFLWGFRTGDNCFNKPLVHDGILYCGSRDRYMYALDAKNGRMIWNFLGNMVAITRPSISLNRIYFTLDKLFCYDLKKNEVIWDLNAGECDINIITATKLVDKKLIFFSRDTIIRCVNIDDGSLIWRARPKSSTPLSTSEVFSPPKWNTSLLNTLDEELTRITEKQNVEVKNFEPYTFTDLFDGIHSLEKENHPNNPYVLPDDGAIGAYRPDGEKKRYGGNAKKYGL